MMIVERKGTQMSHCSIDNLSTQVGLAEATQRTQDGPLAVNQEHKNIYEHLQNYGEDDLLTDENIKETREIQENNMIFNINKEWEMAGDSPECSESEDD